MAQLARLNNIGRLWTSTGDPVLCDGCVIFDSKRIRWIGPVGSEPAELRDDVTRNHDARGLLVTPGLIDAHAHPLYVDARLDEVAARTEGAAYAELAADGGIGRTVRDTRRSKMSDLEAAVCKRLQEFLRAGTTTVEVKTGYHLTIEAELHAVTLLARLSKRRDLPELYITYLAAHDIPPQYELDRAAWIDDVRASVPQAALNGACSVDIFCDEGYFTTGDAAVLAAAASENRLDFRLHADELADVGAARFAAEVRARSADHLLEIGSASAEALARAGVVATLCPLTAAALRKRMPTLLLRNAGAIVALGSDHNPGQTGVTSMATVVWAAANYSEMSVAEALDAATIGSAQALGFRDRGAIAVGRRPDMVVWDGAHEGAFAWHPTLAPLSVLHCGQEIPTA